MICISKVEQVLFVHADIFTIDLITQVPLSDKSKYVIIILFLYSYN